MSTIVVGVDGSDESTAALKWAIEEARLRGVPVLALHAWELPVLATPAGLGPPHEDLVTDLTGLREGAEELVRTVAEEVTRGVSDVEVRAEAREGRPVSVLIDAAEAENAQLIVVGPRGHGGVLGLLLGSVSEQVVRHAPCPVVVHRRPEGD